MLSTNNKLENLIARYGRSRCPVSVDFRKMVGGLVTDRFTHLIHPYPAKLLVHIPHFFLSNTLLSIPGDVVLDPFCGSGTVLLEALLSGREAIGADSNPLARLVSTVKTQPLQPQKLTDSFAAILEGVPLEPSISPPDVINLEYWFYPHVARQLLCILQAIKMLRDRQMRNFFLVCFSVCARKVSLADPRLAVPVRLKKGQYPEGHWLREKTDAHLRRLRCVNVIKVFKSVVEVNIRRMNALEKELLEYRTPTICNNAKALVPTFSERGEKGDKPISSNSVQLVITSPPYPGAQKYIRSVSLSMGWLGLCSTSQLRKHKEAIIGREEYRKGEYEKPVETNVRAADRVVAKLRKVNPLRAHIAANYLLEMKQALEEIARVLKAGGYLVLVAGENQICGYRFRTPRYLCDIVENLGLSLRLFMMDNIDSRGLMTKRNKTASIITRECIMLFQKEA